MTSDRLPSPLPDHASSGPASGAGVERRQVIFPAALDLDAAQDFVVARTRRNMERFGDQLPSFTVAGRYQFVENGGWVGGFWNGILNLCYELTGDDAFLNHARSNWRRYLDRLHKDAGSLDHDVGFLFVPSFVADYKLTKNATARSVALEAAALFLSRFNAKGQFLNCWNVWQPGETFSEENRGRIIIDSLYNVPLLFWAAQQTGDSTFDHAALAHCRTCARHLVRPDGTTSHTFVFDPTTGQPKHARTHQGYADNSCWARGQAWAIGGFAHAHRYTGDGALLSTAIQCAAAFVERVGPGGVARWDFSLAARDDEPIDTSATAIAATGLLELARALGGDAADLYRKQAMILIRELIRNHSSISHPDEEGLLLHGCGHRPANVAVDASLIYGDYFLVEAIARLRRRSFGYW